MQKFFNENRFGIVKNWKEILKSSICEIGFFPGIYIWYIQIQIQIHLRKIWKTDGRYE